MDSLDQIGTTANVAINLAAEASYVKLTVEEIEEYSNTEITDDLTLGGIHAHKSWEYYYQYLSANVFRTSFYDEVVHEAARHECPRILSVGCGHGGHELAIARLLRDPYELIAVDLNPGIVAEAARRAKAEHLNIGFKALDLNFVAIQPGAFDIIYAMASIHHILNLEHFLAQVHRGLKNDGLFIVMDMIGKTQVLFWRENVEFAAGVIKRMPRRYRPPVGKRVWKHLRFDPYQVIPRYADPVVQVGMEGIRQEEIEPLMARWFTPAKRFYYNAYMRIICTNPYLGLRLNPADDEDRRYLEQLIALEMAAIKSRRLKPTEMFGVFRKIPSQGT